MTSPEACGDLPSFNAWINSLGFCGDLPRSAWITSLGARGSPPLERVEHRVDRLPWIVWITFLERVDGRPWIALITSLRSHNNHYPSITLRLPPQPGASASRPRQTRGSEVGIRHPARSVYPPHQWGRANYEYNDPPTTQFRHPTTTTQYCSYGASGSSWWPPAQPQDRILAQAKAPQCSAQARPPDTCWGRSFEFYGLQSSTAVLAVQARMFCIWSPRASAEVTSCHRPHTCTHPCTHTHTQDAHTHTQVTMRMISREMHVTALVALWHGRTICHV